jgi:hypothetical protein
MTDRQIKCTVCGALGEVGCEHFVEGAYRPLAYFVTEALKEHPEKSDRMIAEELGVDHKTVGAARNQLGNYSPVAKRVGRDGKARRQPRRLTKTRRATPQEAEAAGFKPTGEARVVIDTGEVVGKVSAIKLEAEAAATADKDAIIAELKAENDQLRYELNQRPTIHDLRRSDAIANHTQRITTDIDTYNLFRRCLHPDSRNSVSDEMLHQAWLAFRNLEQLTYDKKKIPPPLPKDLGELLRQRQWGRAKSK